MIKNIFQIRVSGITFISDKLLLITHKKEGKEYWVFPGGRVEFGEKAEDAIVRELLEELNLKVKIKRFLFYNESLPPDYPVHSLNLFFLLKPLNTEIKLEGNSIIGKYKLFKKTAIRNIELYPKINNVVIKNFSLWLNEIR